MYTPRSITKIIGGKIVKIPVQDDPRPASKLNATYPSSKYDGILPSSTFNIKDKYAVLPPITNSREQLAQRVADALANVPKHHLENAKRTFKRIDNHSPGRITVDELRQAFMLHRIFILGSTMDALVKTFEAKDGGVLHEPLMRFLSDCREKSSGVGYSPLPPRLSLTGKGDASQLSVKVENTKPVGKCDVKGQTGGRAVSSNVMKNAQTQTSSGRKPIQVSVRGRRLELYAPDAELHASAVAPEERLHLEWVYGYRGKDCRNNLHTLASGEVLYSVASVAVVYDVNHNKQRHYLEHGGPIKSIAVHPDGSTVATGQGKSSSAREEPHIRVWDSTNLQTRRVLGMGHFQKAVSSVSFSVKVGVERGNYLVSIDDDENHTMAVWEWSKNKKLANARGHMDQVVSARFSPFENNLLVSCGKRHLSFWAMDDNNKLMCTRARFDKYSKPDYVTCVAYMMNGDVLTADTNGSMYLWPEGSNQISMEVRNAHDGPIYALFVLSNGIVLSAGGSDATVRAWNRNLKPTNVQLKLPKLIGGICSLAVNGGELYMGTVQNEVWTTSLALGTSPLTEASRGLKNIVRGHTQMHGGLATRQPGRPRFASGGLDGDLILWDADTHNAVWSVKLAGSIEVAAFTPDGTRIGVGFKDGRFSLVDASSGETRFDKKIAKDRISDLKFSSDGAYVALASHDRHVYVLQLFSDGQSVRLLSKLEGHASQVSQVDWSRDDTRLQSTSTDYELLFWDVGQGEQVTSAESMRNTTWATQNCMVGYQVKGLYYRNGPEVVAMDKSATGSLLAVGDEQGGVLLFRFPCVDKEVEGHASSAHTTPVTCVRFLDDASRVVSCGGRGGSLLQWKLVKSI